MTEENILPKDVDFNDPAMKSKIDELKKKLGIGEEEPVEGLTPEAEAARKEADATAPAAISGKDMNWDDYELDLNYAHFYPGAELVETGSGLKWVATIDEFRGDSKTWTGNGVGKNGEPKGIGPYITWMLNGAEKWKIATILPDGSGLVGVLFQRKVRISLPDPKLIEKEVTVPAPTDAEIAALEAESVAWAGTGGAVEGADYDGGNDAGVEQPDKDSGTQPVQ